jgi:hypothetical protein
VTLSETQLLLFGGGAGNDDEAVQFADCWLLTLPEDASTGRWQLVETSGEAPCARTGHSLALLRTATGSALVLLAGGCSATLGHLSDVHLLDTTTWQWSAGPADAFSPRDKLSAVSLGSRVLLFGGFGPILEVDEREEGEEEEDDELPEEQDEEAPAATAVSFGWHNDLWSIELGGDGRAVCQRVATEGEPPAARAAHGAAVLGGSMYIFGGRTATGRAADTWSLSPEMRWRKAELAASPPARSQGSMVALGGSPGSAVLFGGVDAEDKVLDDLSVLALSDGAAAWHAVESKAGSWPAARSGAAAAVLGSKVILLGGVNAAGQHTPHARIDVALSFAGV